MALIVDQCEPQSLDELREFQKSTDEATSTVLSTFKHSRVFPHIIFHGSNGCGKSTRARLLIKEICNGGKPLVCKKETFQLDGGKVSADFYSSSIHKESDLRNRDRQVVQQIIKEFANVSSASSMMRQGQPRIRIFVIHEADKLSLPAQASLRRTMEKYVDTMRIFLLTEQLSGIIAPLRSRCMCVPVKTPTPQWMSEHLQQIAEKQDMAKMSPDLLQKITLAADGNIRRALVLLNQYCLGMRGADAVGLPWQKSVRSIVSSMIANPSVSTLIAARAELLACFVSGLDMQLLMQSICSALIGEPTLPYESKTKIVQAAAHYSESLLECTKPTMHIEGFIAASLQIISVSKTTA